ncbi:hypothetical protein LIER_05785 [Lithospermum erythrorhizon]|uniref:Reverse transcriptase n=1 Tax=Lithospermum erythrorhizon TaxID=34254 RepID=A0AAV3P346_LITER
MTGGVFAVISHGCPGARCKETARTAGRYLGSGTSDSVVVVPNNPKSDQRRNPFSLVYGSNTLLLVEIQADTARVTYYDELANEQCLRLNLDLLVGKRAIVVDTMAKYKKKEAADYNKMVRSRQFLVGDLVLRPRQTSAHGKLGKLESPWKGPYIIQRIVGPVTYELEILEGRQVPSSWNACHLRKYYV